MRRALHGRLLGLPDFLEIRVLLFQTLERVFQGAQALAGRFVGLFLQRFALDLELNDAPLELVQRLGLGVDFHANQRSRLIDQIDGFVGQLAIGDVAMRQRGRCNDRRIGDLHAVMHFIALFEPAQNRDGVLHRRLVDQDFLEAPLERRVLLDVLAVFIERGRAHAMQFAACQRRLEHVPRIHGAFGLARADHGVQFVDEENDLPFLLR